MRAYGYLLTVNQPGPVQAAYWAKSQVAGGWQLELAFDAFPDDPVAWVTAAIELPPGVQSLIVTDANRQSVRLGWFDGDRLVALLLLDAQPVLASRAWLVAQLAQVLPTAAARARILAGVAGADQPDPGPTVCACFGVGANQITTAMDSDPGIDVDGIGKTLKAGTNCGSCRGEIAALLRQHRSAEQTA